MGRQRRCSIPDAAAPRPASSGSMRVMIVHGGGTDPPGVVYVYASDRKSDRPITHLSGFKGVLQVDGYAGYRALAERGDVKRVFCWSHVRRYFYELAVGGPAPIAREALERIAELYQVEAEIRGCPAEARRTARQEKSLPIVKALEPWLRSKLELISQKSQLAEAIRYALIRWKGLTRFLGDGRIEIDSNTVERSIRPITLNRKNALFAGSDGGAARRRPVTAAALARELQVSERTICRDLSELAAQGAPVQGEAGVGYMLRPGLFLPPLMLTEDETEAVLPAMLALHFSYNARASLSGATGTKNEGRTTMKVAVLFGGSFVVSPAK
jgi:biotin operon repressor